jgi:DNA-binding transcriptional LysR family regulator
MTEQGARILLRARGLVRDFADLRSVANDSTLSGELRLGACPTALAGMLPAILARMVGKFPQINVYIQPGYSAQLYGSVESGDLDAAFVIQAPYELPKTCDWQLLREEPLVVLVPKHGNRTTCSRTSH